MPVYLQDGKVLLGSDGKVAIDPSCCCAPPITCDSIAVSKNQCANLFAENVGFLSDPERFYLKQTTVYSVDVDETVEVEGQDFHFHLSSTRVDTVDLLTCENGETCGGSGTSDSGTGGPPGETQCSFALNLDTGCGWVATPVSGPDPCPPAPFIDCTPVSATECHGDNGSGTIIDVTLSDEYTTDRWKAAVEATLPDYSGNYGCEGDHSLAGQGCLCYAYRNLSDDGSSITIQRFKFQETFDAAVTDRTIYWTEHFVPYPSGSPVDTEMSDTVPAGATEFVHEVLEPAENGTTTVTRLSFTAP
jgi:hypothetical protein